MQKYSFTMFLLITILAHTIILVRYGFEKLLLKQVVGYHNIWTKVMIGTAINAHPSFLTISYGWWLQRECDFRVVLWKHSLVGPEEKYIKTSNTWLLYFWALCFVKIHFWKNFNQCWLWIYVVLTARSAPPLYGFTEAASGSQVLVFFLAPARSGSTIVIVIFQEGCMREEQKGVLLWL